MQTYEWAENKIKLQAAILQLKEAQKANPSIVITEDMIKAAYVARCGNVLAVAEPVTEPVTELIKEVVPEVGPEVVADVEYEVSVKEVKKDKSSKKKK